MDFTHFAKMLYSRIGGEQTKAEFIITLVTEIMEKSFIDIEENHPLSDKEDDTLMRIFNGTRRLSRSDAGTILSHLDKKRFGDYLAQFSNDAIDLIGSDMQDNGVMIVSNDIIDTCTDLFVTIIKNIGSHTNEPYGQWLNDEIEHYRYNQIVNQFHKICKKAENNPKIAELIRNIFDYDISEYDNGPYRMEDFMGDPKELGMKLDDDNPLNDILILFQTVYEANIDLDMYEDTMELTKKINLYIKKSTAGHSKNGSTEIAELKKEIVNLLCHIYDIDS